MSDSSLLTIAQSERGQAVSLGYLGTWRSWDFAVAWCGDGGPFWSYYIVPLVYRIVSIFPLLLPTFLAAAACAFLGMAAQKAAMRRAEQPMPHLARWAIISAQFATGAPLVLAALPISYFAPLMIPIALAAIPWCSYSLHRHLPIQFFSAK